VTFEEVVDMSSFYELIRRIQKRPSMYLGKPSINNLQAFLAGYSLARQELNTPDLDESDFEGFQSWVQKKFNISSSQSWDKIILFFSEDENSALITFFRLLDEFLDSKPSVVAQELISVPAIANKDKLTEVSPASESNSY
jgi:hypothetical protein